MNHASVFGLTLCLIGVLFITAGLQQKTPVALIKDWVKPQ
jgi:hypothetical protein